MYEGMPSTHSAAISSGKPHGYFSTLTFLKQYTTSMPITAYGSTLPRYVITFGLFLPSGNAKNGEKRKNAITTAITPTKIKECPTSIIGSYLAVLF